MNASTVTPTVRHDHPPHELWVVDTTRQIEAAASAAAHDAGFVVRPASPEALVAHATEVPHGVALIDDAMPQIDALALLRDLKHQAPGWDVLVSAGTASVERAVDALKLGAVDYLAKPLDAHRLAELLQALPNGEAPEAGDGRGEFGGLRLRGRSESMKRLEDLIRRVGPHFTAALICGETGTGKELVARALHAASVLHDRPFVTVRCSAADDELLDETLEELRRTAAAAASEGGALPAGAIFFDDVHELTAHGQLRLLHLLETSLGEADAFGSAGPRIIAATNHPLDRDVQAGRFRADLFFRIQGVEIQVPALRARREDIPDLARAFVEECAVAFGKPLRGITVEGERLLTQQDWPGNVRELKHVIARACMLADGEWIEADALARPTVIRPGSDVPVRPMHDVEREQVTRALAETQGNKKEAAKRLGISRRAFYRRLEKYGLYTPGRDERHDTEAA